MRRLALLLALIPTLAVADISWVATGTKFGGTSGTSSACGAPAGLVVGDVVIAIMWARETAYAMSTSTTGWTNKAEGALTNVRYGLWWMRYSGNESMITVTRSTGAQAWVGFCIAIRGVTPTGDPFDVVGSWSQGTASPFTASAATTATDRSWALALFGSVGAGSLPVHTISTGSITTTTNLLQNQTQSGTTNRAVASAWRGSAVITPAGTTGTQAITWTNTTSNYSAGVIVALKYDPAYPPSGGMSGFYP